MLTYRAKMESNKLAEIARTLPDLVRDEVAVSLSEIETDIKLAMRGTKTGRLYRRGKTRMHQASAPYQAPAIDYGHLVNSIQQKMYTTVIGGEVFTNAEYAAALEYGTRRMAPRPFMEPAFTHQVEKFIARLRDLERKL